MKTYDVVVIGAGPGGSGAATTAAKLGLHVLMIEKRQEIGVPKRCGEGLSRTSALRIGVEPDPLFTRREIKGATAYSPDGKFVRVDYKDGPEGWVIDRKVFDKYLAKRAVAAGAKVMAKTEAMEIVKKDGMISGLKLETEGRAWEVKTHLIIAADGVESRMAREAGLDTNILPIDLTSGAQYEMAGVDIDPDRLELFFGNDVAPGGYVWIFPKGKDSANVGIGVRRPFAKKSAFEYLRDFIESRPGLRKGSVLEVNSGGVPVGGFLQNMVTDGLMVIGDAAHQVNPIHGGGIAESYIGGRLAGELAAEAKKAGDYTESFLNRYNKLWWKERGNDLSSVLKLRKVMEKLSDDDLNWLAGQLSGENLVDCSRGHGLKIMAKIFMKRPSLIGLARQLL